MLRYSELKDAGMQFLTVTGVPSVEFEGYLAQFVMAYDKLYPPEQAVTGQPHQQQTSGDGQGPLAQIEDKLLFIWMYQKVKWLQPELALQFDLSPSQVVSWIDHLLPVWQLTLTNLTKTNLQPNCVQFLQLLDRYQVEYLVVGGHAVAF